MRQDTNLLSLAAAAGAGALFMYYLDAKHGARGRAQNSARHATDRMKGVAARLHGTGEQASDEEAGKQALAAHATAPAQDSWNEQGV